MAEWLGVDETARLAEAYRMATTGDALALRELADRVEGHLSPGHARDPDPETRVLAQAVRVATTRAKGASGSMWKELAVRGAECLLDLTRERAAAYQRYKRRGTGDAGPVMFATDSGGERERMLRALFAAGEAGLEVTALIRSRFPSGARQALGRLLREGVVESLVKGRVRLSRSAAAALESATPAPRPDKSIA